MTNAPPQLMIVDDEEIARRNLAYIFKKEGYGVTICANGESALTELSRKRFEIVLTDLRMPGIDGMALLTECQKRWPTTRVIMITGYASLENAVAAMKSGAYHYLAKPFRIEEVRELVIRALEVIRLENENQLLREQLTALQAGVQIITQAPLMLALLETARRIAVTHCTVLIGGESGVGKELLARFIHEQSPRRANTFIAINCGAFHDDLLDNELFGHEKGAFTGARAQRKGLIESAEGGTLFLDEIGETSPRMQIKLLRVLEERELYRVGGNQLVRVDVRFLAASNRNLAEAVAEGRFRRDLYFRLNVMELRLPPLVERREDIPLLANYFLHKHGALLGRRLRALSDEALALLKNYDYPGNIRELSNLIERGIALADGDILEARHLPEQLQTVKVNIIRAPFPTLEEYEQRYIAEIMQHTGGNRTQAARILGIDRVSLWRKLKHCGIIESQNAAEENLAE